jgi:hypothetical protein
MTATATATTATDTPVRPAQALRQPPTFYRDPVSCLQSTFGAVLAHHGHDPLATLGAHWEFRFAPGDVRPEEFYLPCRFDGDVAHSLAPGHPLHSRWAVPDADDPLAELAGLIADGVLPIAAVDNYHLPFRPAYHDVHAAHLVLVYGVDVTRGLVLVSDTMPPAFAGPIRVEDFLNAWGSPNPADDQDAFFSDAGIGRRYLVLDVGEPWPADDPATLAAAVRDNLAGLRAAADAEPAHWTGLAGLRRYVDTTVDAARAGSSDPLRELYTFGWSQQAGCALHGELLRSRGHRWGLPALREAGRAVEAAAHTWSGLRVTAAHGWPEPEAAADDLRRHGERLHRRYAAATDLLDRALHTLTV